MFTVIGWSNSSQVSNVVGVYKTRRQADRMVAKFSSVSYGAMVVEGKLEVAYMVRK